MPRQYVILYVLALFSNGQSVAPPIIDSNGQLRLDRKFQAICHHTFVGNSATMPALRWNCTNTTKYHSGNQFERAVTAPGSRDTRSQVTLTIDRVECDHDKIVCECMLTGNDGSRSREFLHLIVIIRPQIPKLTIKPGASSIIENANTEITCEGNVGRPLKSLRVFLFPQHGSLMNGVTIPTTATRTVRGCSYNVRVKGVYNFNRQHTNYTVVCQVDNMPNIKKQSDALTINYLVSEVKIRFTADLINAEIRKEVVAYCETESYPAPDIAWYFTENSDTPELLHVVPTKIDERRVYVSQYRFAVKKKDSIELYCTAENKLPGPNGQRRKVTSHVIALKPPDVDATSLGTIIGAVVGSIIATLVITITSAVRKHKEADNADEDRGYDDPGVDMRTYRYDTSHYETPIVTMQHSPVTARRDQPEYEYVLEEYEPSVSNRQPASQYTRLDYPGNSNSLSSKSAPPVEVVQSSEYTYMVRPAYMDMSGSKYARMSHAKAIGLPPIQNEMAKPNVAMVASTYEDMASPTCVNTQV